MDAICNLQIHGCHYVLVPGTAINQLLIKSAVK
jgi:hypothetical protein